MAKEKNQYFQLIRGLCIIFVILIHLPTGLSYERTSFYYNFYMLERNIIGIAVPAFFAMSGYFTPPPPRISTKKVFDRRLYIPFLVWSVIYGFWNTGTDIFSLKGIAKTILGLNASHLYFIFVLIQIRFLLPFFAKYKKCSFMPYLITAVTVVWYGWYYAAGVFGAVEISLPIGFTCFSPAWIIYWYIGFMLKDNDFSKGISCGRLAAACVFFLALATAESYLIDIYDINVSPVSQMRVSNLLYCMCAVLLIFKIQRNIKPNFLTKIGDVSYGIYYIHYIFIYILNRYPDIIGAIPLPLLHIIGAAAVIGCSTAVIFLFKKLLGNKAAANIFGF